MIKHYLEMQYPVRAKCKNEVHIGSIRYLRH